MELIERHQIRPTEAPVPEARSPQRLVDASQKGLGPVVLLDLIRLDHDDLPTKESTFGCNSLNAESLSLLDCSSGRSYD